MTQDGTNKDTPLLAEPDATDGPVPATAAPIAEVQPPKPGEAILPLSLTLSEVGCIAASLQTLIRFGVLHEPSQVTLANSVLRKFHDAKQELVRSLPL